MDLYTNIYAYIRSLLYFTFVCLFVCLFVKRLLTFFVWCYHLIAKWKRYGWTKWKYTEWIEPDTFVAWKNKCLLIEMCECARMRHWLMIMNGIQFYCPYYRISFTISRENILVISSEIRLYFSYKLSVDLVTWAQLLILTLFDSSNNNKQYLRFQLIWIYHPSPNEAGCETWMTTQTNSIM